MVPPVGQVGGRDSYPPNAGPRERGSQRDRRNHRRHRGLGLRVERRIKTKSFEFFNDKGFSARTTPICTAAVADIAAARPGAGPGPSRNGVGSYPNRDYGGSGSGSWISYGSAPALQTASATVPPCASPPPPIVNRDNLSAALEASDLVTAVTHNHPGRPQGRPRHHPRHLAGLPGRAGRCHSSNHCRCLRL